MSSPPAEAVLVLILLHHSASAFPTGSDQGATSDALKQVQCQLNPNAPECRSVLPSPEPTSASSEHTSTTSETWSQMPPTPSETNSSATALEESWSSADPSPEPHSLATLAQRSLSGRVILFLYRMISRSDILNQIESVARRRKNDYWPMLIGMFTVGGTLLTAGMAALAAMSGKALMSSMLALGMSLMSALRAPARRCRRSVGTGRGGGDGCGNGNANYELLEQPYPGYVRSFLDVPLDSAGAATIPAGVPTSEPAATWINYRVPDNMADNTNTAWTPTVVGMRSPARTMNITSGMGSWGPGPPATGPSSGTPDAANGYSNQNQPRELTYSGGYSTIKTVHE